MIQFLYLLVMSSNSNPKRYLISLKIQCSNKLMLCTIRSYPNVNLQSNIPKIFIWPSFFAEYVIVGILGVFEVCENIQSIWEGISVNHHGVRTSSLQKGRWGGSQRGGLLIYLSNIMGPKTFWKCLIYYDIRFMLESQNRAKGKCSDFFQIYSI